MRPIVRKRILSKHGNKCCKCGSTERLEIDHIIPLCRGGSDNEENKQVLCKACNRKKGRGIDFDRYFQLGVDPDRILISPEFKTIMPFLTDKELHLLLESMFKRNDEAFSE